MIGSPAFHFGEAASTQDLLRQIAGRGSPVGTAVSADHQTHGRGTKGRPWISLPPPQFYLSVLLSGDLPPPKRTLLSIASGLAVVEAIETFGFGQLAIKWPNDVLIGGKKAGGILCEAFGSQIAVGIGVNLRGSSEDFPAGIRAQAAALSMHSPPGRVPSGADLRSEVFRQLDRYQRDLESGNSASIRSGFARYWAWRDRQLRIRSGGETVSGRASEIDDDGALLLRTEAGALLRVVTGEILPF